MPETQHSPLKPSALKGCSGLRVVSGVKSLRFGVKGFVIRLFRDQV